MGRTVTEILGAVEIGVGIATNAWGLVAVGVGTLASAALAPNIPKPGLPEEAKKSSTPERISGYAPARTSVFMLP